MKKRIFLSILSFIFAHGYVFLSFSFVSKSFDFTLWSDFWRLLCVLVSFIAGIVLVFSLNCYLNDLGEK